MKNSIRILVVMLIMLSAFNAHAEKMRIAIIDFRAKDISRSDALKVSELIRSEMVDIGRFTILERTQMKEILKEQGFQQSGCTDISCAVKVGKILSASKILVGTVMKLGDSIIISGRIVDVEKGVAEFSTNQEAKNKNQLLRAVRKFVKKLSGRIRGFPSNVYHDTGYTTTQAAASRGPIFDILIGGGLYKPTGKFGDHVEDNYGINCTMSFFVGENTMFGMGMGYVEFKEKQILGRSGTESFTIIPYYLNLSYRLYMGPFYLRPYVTFGGLLIFYSNWEVGNSEEWESYVNGGCAFGLDISSNMYIEVSGDYNYILEDDEYLEYMVFNGGIGFKF